MVFVVMVVVMEVSVELVPVAVTGLFQRLSRKKTEI